MRLLFNDRDLDAPFHTQNPFALKLLDRFFAELLPECLPAASRTPKPATFLRGACPEEPFSSGFFRTESSVCRGFNGSAGLFHPGFAGRHFGRF